MGWLSKVAFVSAFLMFWKAAAVLSVQWSCWFEVAPARMALRGCESQSNEEGIFDKS